MEKAEGTCLLSLRNTFYYLLPLPPGKIPLQQATQLDRFHEKLLPFTVLTWVKDLLNQSDLESVFDRFSTEDDVWCRDFSSVIVLLKPHNVACEMKVNTTVLTVNTIDLKLANGPYVLCKATGQLYSVCKLYDDTHHAFVSGILPRPRRKDGFRALGPLMDDSDAGSGNKVPAAPAPIKIPVPSRLYYRSSRRRPLAGLRIAVKDVIRLQGLRTGYGNNAWHELSQPEKTTAPAIKLLLAAGAVIVGKVKTSEFTEGVDPHQWMGSTCPVNPRGDGEQKPSSSSTGSAVAAAAYPWLDCTIGTDTGGSIRHPAGVNGLFGNRPTQSAISLSGVLGATDLLNTVGIFARDASTFTKIGMQLLPKSFQPIVPQSDRKYKLLYPVRGQQDNNTHQPRWFPNSLNGPTHLTEAEKQMETFVQHLEHNLSCKRVPFNLDELWRALKPVGQPDTLDEATGHIYSALVSYSALHEGGINRFLSDYTASHSSHEPIISPIVKLRLEYGRSLQLSEIAQHLESMQVFATWVETVLFGSIDEEEITLLVFPQSFGIPNYRHDVPAKEIAFYEKFSVFAFGYLVGCPDYTVPVGEVPFESRVTGERGYLPVSVSMVARKGNDGPLFDILTLLEEEGVLRGVKTGRRMY